jgi:Dyp-type peroxidase family
MPHVLSSKGINKNLQPTLKLLADLQGNILTGHGRNHALHIFLEFQKKDPTKKKAKEWIKSLSTNVTPAEKQYKESSVRRERRKENPPAAGETYKIIPGVDDLPFVNFFLSAEGYRFLGLKDKGPREPSFLAGMEKRSKILNDSPKKDWEPSFHSGTIHAMLLVANDDPRMLQDVNLASSIGLIIKNNIVLNGSGQPIAKILSKECGAVLHKNFRGLERPVEHFGYVDGLSDARFTWEDEEKINRDWREGGSGGSTKWDPRATLNLVLVPDPLGDSNAAGSYLVFRKLEQNVQKFQILKHELTKKLKDRLDGPSVAYSVGRFQDGTPVTRLPNYNFPLNDFDFKAYDNLSTHLLDDLDKVKGQEVGIRCPIHAHVRKMNPRETIPSQMEIDRRIIVRRGIPYDHRPHQEQLGYKPPDDTTPPENLPTETVGLLFMCFQRSIADQFEFIQRRANGAIDPENPSSQFEPNSFDPIIGQPPKTESQSWPVKWNDPSKGILKFSFSHVVTLKGGEYFFAPSISFLKKIDQIK